MSANPPAIRLGRQGAVAEIVLDRPEAGNTFTPELLEELAGAARSIATDPTVRAVVLRGEGPNFCYGASVDMFLATPAEDRPRLLRDLVTRFHGAVSQLLRLEVPVLGVVHGNVIGGGLALTAACDVVLAAASSRFRLAWTGIGITMDGGSTWLLPRIVGVHRTLELAYTNRLFDAAEAQAWGLVNWTAPDAELDARRREISAMLAGGATRALGACKRLVLTGGSESFETHLENEAGALVRAFATRDADEGLRAFREKRRPAFTGE